MSQAPGLEFDARQSGTVSDDGLHAVSPISRVFNQKTQYMDSANIPPQGQPQQKRIFGFRRAVFWFSIVTALALALAIVAAAVGGSLAVKRADQLQQAQAKLASCAPQPETNTTLPNPSPVSPTRSVNPSTFTAYVPQASGTLSANSDNSSCIPVPFSNCGLLGPTWTAVSYYNVQFNISCNTTFHGGDLIFLQVYQFEDCINACASYNQLILAHPGSNCSAVSFSADSSENCALKDSTANVPSDNNQVDSAILIPS
ncbi:hypothetical protein N7G274_004969 [Stereocaulon virgatum]|uniref:Apple domain-containing protein n=1 Tax=Stereocaulon virgatum TaxID=373712 RepID=A0ABR4AAL3_9LECA